MVLYLFACTGNTPEPQVSNPPGTEFAVVATVALDYSVGSLATASLEGIVADDIASISGDPALNFDAGYLWQINRFQYDTIRKYDPQNLLVPTTEVSVAPPEGSSNPHEVVECQNKLYVSLYEQKHVLILDIENLSEIGRVDISPYADSDDRTEASSLIAVDDRIYLGLQGLDRNNNYTGVGSTILEIDCNTDNVTNDWKQGNNINLYFDQDQGTIMVTTEAWNNQDGGIYSFSPADSSWEPVVTSANRNITAMATTQDHIVYVVSDLSLSENFVGCFNKTTESVQEIGPYIEWLTEVATNSKEQAWITAHWGWIDINNAKPGIYRIDPENCEEIEEPLEFNLAPFNIAFVQID